MARPIILFTNAWIDTPLADLAAKVAEWGYDGVELTAAGEHLDVRAATDDPAILAATQELLHRHELQVPTVSNHRIGTAVCDALDRRHQALLPPAIWGDGHPEGVRRRAAADMSDSFRIAAELGANVVSGFTGSSIWHLVNGYPSAPATMIDEGFDRFAVAWNPILDAAGDAGVRFAFEVHPGQIAFDLVSAERTLDALNGRPEFGFTFDPSHFHWQGIDPIAFLRRFPDRIYHVHVKDCALTLDGRAGILNGYLPSGDERRGWQNRCPGRGGIDWEGILRALDRIAYAGPLSVEFHDRAMDRDFGAREAIRFLRGLEFDAPTS